MTAVTKKPNKIQRFLCSSYTKGSYNNAFRIFLKKHSKRVSKHTVSRFFYSLKPIGETLQNPPINTIKADWLKKYVEELWLRYAPDSIRTIIADIKFFFKWCKSKKHHPKNIAKRIKPIYRRRSKGQKAAPEESMKKVIQNLAYQLNHTGMIYRNLFNFIEIKDPKHWSDQMKRTLRDLFIITFLYETGARVGELCKLGSKAINTATHQPAKAYHITVTGKTDDRDYFFTQKTAELWRMWQKVRPEQHREYAIVGWRSSRPVSPLNPSSISKRLARQCENLQIKPFRSHAIRHAKIKRSRKAVGIEIASILVDHSKLDTTWGYANIDEDELIEAALATGLKLNIWQHTQPL